MALFFVSDNGSDSQQKESTVRKSTFITVLIMLVLIFVLVVVILVVCFTCKNLQQRTVSFFKKCCKKPEECVGQDSETESMIEKADQNQITANQIGNKINMNTSSGTFQGSIELPKLSTLSEIPSSHQDATCITSSANSCLSPQKMSNMNSVPANELDDVEECHSVPASERAIVVTAVNPDSVQGEVSASRDMATPQTPDLPSLPSDLGATHDIPQPNMLTVAKSLPADIVDQGVQNNTAARCNSGKCYDYCTSHLCAILQ